MSVSSDEIEHAVELFSGLGEITTRKMMGGLCLYSEGTIFAILHADLGLMLKGGGAFKDELDAEGLTRWTYSRDGKKEVAMPYWTLPEAAMEDPAIAVDWARRALAHL